MEIVQCTLDDYQQIVAQIVEFWGSERTLSLHHPLFVHELGDTAFCFRAGTLVTAYLFGLLSQTAPAAYVHLVGVHPTYRGYGLARQLYQHFSAVAQARGCTALNAITTPGNSVSIAFHRALGMDLLGMPNAEGIPVITNYAGPGQDRVVFHRTLT